LKLAKDPPKPRLTVFQDVAKRRELERLTKEFKDLMRKSEEAKERFLNSLSVWGKFRSNYMTLRQPGKDPFFIRHTFGIGIRGIGMTFGIILLLAFANAQLGSAAPTPIQDSKQEWWQPHHLAIMEVIGKL
jgi:hypothetical protein